MDSRFDESRKAEKTGHCEVCGWKDGQGVKQCYYDEEVGTVMHQNSNEAYLRSLSPSQRSLEESYNSHRTAWKAADIERMRKMLLPLVGESDEGLGAPNWTIGCSLYSKKSHPTKEATVDAWLKDKSGLEELLKQGYTIKGIDNYEMGSYHLVPGFKCEQFEIQKPHDCGGFGVFAGSYHIKCTGCNCEIKMWEHGIDYDVG